MNKVVWGGFFVGKQIRKCKGGGTRTPNLKESIKAGILKYAKDLLLPNG